MRFGYRGLTQADLETICSFPQSAEELFFVSPRAVYPLTPEQVWTTAQERQYPTVVYDADTSNLVAYANLYDWDEATGACWLGNVITAPAYRGTGAGAYLLRVMEEQAASLGARTLKLYCLNPNTRALWFYLKHGFVLTGGYKLNERGDGSKIVSLEMEKRLS